MAAVALVPAVEVPAGHGVQPGNGLSLLPTGDQDPLLQAPQVALAPKPAGQMRTVQLAAAVAAWAAVVAFAGQPVQFGAGIALVPAADHVPRAQAAQEALRPYPARQTGTVQLAAEL